MPAGILPGWYYWRFCCCCCCCCCWAWLPFFSWYQKRGWWKRWKRQFPSPEIRSWCDITFPFPEKPHVWMRLQKVKYKIIIINVVTSMINFHTKNWVFDNMHTSIEKEFDFLASVTTSFLQKSAWSAEPGKLWYLSTTKIQINFPNFPSRNKWKLFFLGLTLTLLVLGLFS